MRTGFLCLLLLLSAPACAFDVYVGEESYFIWRMRDGGTKQDGRLDGVRVGFDRLRGNRWYLGADYLYATGKMSGQTGRGSPQKSTLTDEIVEVRFGYTLAQCIEGHPYFTPFIGWGYFKETNDFAPPSPLPITFTDTFNFAAVGFLSGVNLTPLLSMGFNFKVRFMQNGTSKVTEDPLFDDVTLSMEDEIQCRLEVPFTCAPRDACLGLKGEVVPFYAYRHFGGREGYPFNFRDTKFHLIGLRLSLLYRY